MHLTLQRSLLDRISELVALEPQVLDWASVSLQQSLPQEELLKKWISDGNHASMDWIPAGLAARLNPVLLLEGAQSIALFLWKYPQPLQKSAAPVGFQVAAYAQGEDYHRTAGHWMSGVLASLTSEFPSLQARLFVDTLPLQERAWAAASGLGWIGKNSMLIHPKFGSGFCLVGFLATEYLEKTATLTPGQEFCGKCNRCIDACPTHAILDNRTVDSRRCISCLTIEKRDNFSETEMEMVQGWIFGCDICQTVCPWNQKHLDTSDLRFWPTEEAAWANLLVPGNGLRNRLRGTPLDRAGRKGLQRNFNAQKIVPVSR